MIAANVMSTNVISLNLSSQVKDAITLFQTSKLHDFPIIDDVGKPIGIVTTRSILHFAVPEYASDDLLSVIKYGPDISSVYENLAAVRHHTIADVMDKNFMVAKPDMPTSAIAAMLINLKGDTHNILIVDAAGVLIGIISARDIITKQLKNTQTN
ncbi:MAG: CBS domain-containing protein [Mariprofundaceae bacterium]|nr:CBS domain-containing protein [Mariprofundaceae bacterium]